jgi:hypothetical protein
LEFHILRFAVFAEPLQFVFVTLRTQAGQLRHARIKPAERIRKCQRVQRLEVVVFANCDRAGKAGAVIERKNQRSRKIGGIKGAGGVAKMVVKAQKPATREKLPQSGQHRLPRGIPFPAVSPV